VTATKLPANSASAADSGIATSGNSAVSSGDRLSFTAFIAVVVHLVIILGVSFTVFSRNRVPPTLEVTLAQHSEKNAPEQADYLAQNNQDASGTLEKKQEMTTDKRADFSDTSIREVTEELQKRKEISEVIDNEKIISTSKKTDKKIATTKPSNKKEKRQAKTEKDDQDTQRSKEIASLQAKLAQQRQAYAKRPRIKTLTSVSTRASIDAEYLNLWQEKIELIGNLNYPEEARAKKLYGQLRLVVSVLPDGTIHNIEILQSSGQRVLDDAAIRIVRLAAPFAPFPPELRKDVDQLEIIRTWRFEKGNRLSSQ
jgi:protein TonB